jgi:tricorn protease
MFLFLCRWECFLEGFRAAPSRLLLLAGLFLAAAGASAQTLLLRFPDIHGDRVAFTYGGDLWTAPAAGGVAAHLTTHPGLELFPKFSPDGRWIAFTGQYDGDEQVYVIPSGGGVPRQLTFYPAAILDPGNGYDNQVMGWTPDGASILFWSTREADGVTSAGALYTVGLEGGAARKLPIPAAGAGCFAPDGKALVYAPVARDFSGWKRYQGGQAQGLYLFDLATRRQKRVAYSLRTEQDPMWIGDRIYFTSDRDGTLNLYSTDPATDHLKQLTFSRQWDARWASSDHAARIVYELRGGLHVFDLRSGKDQPIAITVPTDGGASRPTRIRAEVESWSLSPKGERALFVARGDVFTVPIEAGPVRDLTRGSAAHDKLACWSPDGRSIAFVSDRSGEEQIYVEDQEGKGPPVALTTTLKAFIRALAWAPDSQRLALADQEGRVYVLGVADRKLAQVAWERDGADPALAWSPDSRFLALTLSHANGLPGVAVWSTADGVLRRITSDLFPATQPAWDPRGRYLYLFSRRDYACRISSVEFDFTAQNLQGIFALALRKDVPHPFPPESDEVTVGDGEAPKVRPPAPGPLRIDWDGLEQRAVRVPVAPGSLERLVALEDRLLYGRSAPQPLGDDSSGQTLCVLDLGKRKETVLAENVQGWTCSQDGGWVLFRQHGAYVLMASVPDAPKRPVSVRDLWVDSVPAREWAEIFEEVWRRYRDFFYARNMHGYDWQALGDKYRPLLKYVTHRSDLTYVLTELVGELNVGHAFLGGGDYFEPDRPKVGLPGARLELDPAARRYRIARIYRGHNQEPRYRSPLTEVGVDAREGDYILAIDGSELRGSDDPYRLLRYKTNPVTLTLNASPDFKGARQVTYVPVESEAALRYLDFVLRSRDRVEQLSGGRVGYLHLPDMSSWGLEEFVKWYYPQIRKEGLVVDVRANSGGNVSELILERLGRKLMGAGFGRSERAETYPDTVFLGPMACLVNESTASDGEIFAYHFRGQGLGPLVGRRTWGGVVGFTDPGPLLDGGYVVVPEQGSTNRAGDWIIEGEGVHPDVVVENDPRSLLEGRDPQLDRGVQEVLRQLAEHSPRLPRRPADPVKTP